VIGPAALRGRKSMRKWNHLGWVTAFAALLALLIAAPVVAQEVAGGEVSSIGV